MAMFFAYSKTNYFHDAHNFAMSSQKCQNCRRRGDDLSFCLVTKRELQHNSRLKYYNIDSNDEHVRICSSCYCYFFENGCDKNCKDYWPAMVYKFLVHENADIGIKVSFEAKWSLLPVKWRRFWREEFSHMQMDGEDGEEVGAFVDMSEEYSMALDVIEKNRWSSLSKCLDKHYAYPEVSIISLSTKL